MGKTDFWLQDLVSFPLMMRYFTIFSTQSVLRLCGVETSRMIFALTGPRARQSVLITRLKLIMPRFRLFRFTCLTFLLLLGLTLYLLRSSPRHTTEGGDQLLYLEKPSSRLSRHAPGWRHLVNTAEDDGMVRGWEGVHEKYQKDLAKRGQTGYNHTRERHPIEELMERGQKRWEGLLER